MHLYTRNIQINSQTMSAFTTTKKTGNRYSVTNTNKGGGKFCKICKDTGKSHEEYTSHYVRETPDPNSRIVCPTLIASVCRYCKNGGHTVKHCPKIQAKNRQELKINTHIISKNYCNETTDSKYENKTNNFVSAFSVLDNDSSDEDEDTNDNVTTPPSSQQTYNSPSVISYASVLKKTPPAAPLVQKETVETTSVVSQVDSLIPTKLDFSGETDTSSDEKVVTDTSSDEKVVTLFDISGNWADDDEVDETTVIFNLVTDRPVFSNETHPLHYYNNKMINSIVNKYTNGYTKKIRITEDAFSELFKRWDTEFFTENDASGTIKITMNVNPSTNGNSRFLSVMNLFTR